MKGKRNEPRVLGLVLLVLPLTLAVVLWLFVVASALAIVRLWEPFVQRVTYTVVSLKTWEGWASLTVVVVMLLILYLSFPLVGLVYGTYQNGEELALMPTEISVSEPPRHVADTYSGEEGLQTLLFAEPRWLGESKIDCGLTGQSSIVLPGERVFRCAYRIRLSGTEIGQYALDGAEFDSTTDGPADLSAGDSTGENQTDVTFETLPPLFEHDRVLADRAEIRWHDEQNGHVQEADIEIESTEPPALEMTRATFVGEFVVAAPASNGEYRLEIEFADTQATQYRDQPTRTRVRVFSIQEITTPLQALIVVGVEASLFRLLVDLWRRIDRKLD